MARRRGDLGPGGKHSAECRLVRFSDCHATLRQGGARNDNSWGWWKGGKPLPYNPSQDCEKIRIFGWHRVLRPAVPPRAGVKVQKFKSSKVQRQQRRWQPRPVGRRSLAVPKAQRL